MDIKNILKTSLHSLRSNRTRSALTILGIVIGITAVIMMVSIGSGAQNLILGQVASMGSNNIFIEPGPWSRGMESGQRIQSMMEEMEIKTLKYEDALAIAKEPTVEKVAPFVMGIDRVSYQNKTKKVSYFGTTPEALDIWDFDLAAGRNFVESDIKSMARVVILGSKIKNDLFGDEDSIGKNIKMKKNNFRVIGVLEEKGTQMFMNMDEFIHFPLTTAQKLLLGQNYLRWIIAKAVSKEKIDEAVHHIRLIVRERHNIYNPEGDLAKDDFKVMSQKETAEILGQVTDIFTIFLSSIAAIALLVGGIGIMNIMLVSVTERTKEIGLRKAVGARNKDILYQFLSEAVTLTIAGGVVGIILGVVFSILVGFILGKVLNVNWGLNISFPAIVIGFGVASFIGLVFGIYPAQKAAKLDPIEALRYE